MRILHVSTRLILGGSQENTVLSCEGQANLGHDVHLAFGPIFGPEGSLLERVDSFRTTDGRSITTHEIPHLVRPIRPVADLRCLGELRRLIREIEPDIVHTHSSKAGVLGRAAAWAERRSRPLGVVHTIHGPPFHRYLPKHINALYILSERFAARRCHVIAAVCQSMIDQFRAASIGRPEQYEVVFSGMEVETFLDAPPAARREIRTELGFTDDDFVIGTVARLAELKGHDDLLDALGDDLREHPNWKLLWVGDGWWRERLLQRVEDLGLRDQVVTTGLVPQDRVPTMMRAMDVLVHASYREGLPRTVPQALLSAVPPVAYDVDGTGEACIDMQTGRLVPPGDTTALRDAIRWMEAHPDERASLATHGRALCRDRFSAETMVAHLEEVYRRALDLDARRLGPTS